MCEEKANDFLYLIWKDPETRRNFTVGKLIRGKKYKFMYVDEDAQARKCGWQGVPSFPNQKGVYESDELFPAFSSRLPDPKRRDMQDILRKYHLKEYDDYELLRKSGAKLPIDTCEFVMPFPPMNEPVRQEFYLMGMRHVVSCGKDGCDRTLPVKAEDELCLVLEPDNVADPHAVRVETKEGQALGYVPRYYSADVERRLKVNSEYKCKALEVNRDEDCSECVKVELSMPCAKQR